MKQVRGLQAYGLIMAGLLVLSGCGGPIADNPLLEEARTAYAAAEQDTMVVRRAPVALREAEEALRRSERLWRKREDRDKVTHSAYIARQRIRIAEEEARLKAAEAEIQRAEVERREVQLEARSREAARAEERAVTERERAEEARRQAERERQQAERARREAQEAQARARELADRIRELEAIETERGLVLTLGDVLFDVGRANLRAEGYRTIDKLANFMKNYSQRRVLIEGHTDNTGSETSNLDLSRRRADSVREALLDRGISSDRIRTRGYGEAYPVASNRTASGRQQNRRVEVVISDREGRLPSPRE